MTAVPALARRAALVFLAASSGAWLAALVLAPVALVRPSASPAVRGSAIAVYLAGRQVCHQRADRCFHLAGIPMPVCARCSGLYAGVPLGLAGGIFWGRIRRLAGAMPRRWMLLAAVPTMASVGLELATGATSGASRAMTAAPLGAAVAALVAAALAAHPEP